MASPQLPRMRVLRCTLHAAPGPPITSGSHATPRVKLAGWLPPEMSPFCSIDTGQAPCANVNCAMAVVGCAMNLFH